MENVSKKELVDIVENSNNPVIKNLAKQKIQDEFKGDEVAQKMIQLSQLISQSTNSQGGVDEQEVKRIVREQIETEKISFENLDDTIKSLLNNQPTKVTITIKQGNTSKVVTTTLTESATRPLIQLILSDVLARNNVYLYGGAGTGKTYSAGIIQDILDWELIEVNCNQFTSALELIGGQTIDGYQEGKVIRAFGNLKEDGTPMDKNGCILLLDELPKIDPNTAGILNSVLARVGEYKDGKPRPIQNAKGDVIPRGNCFIIATGNSLLNTKDAEYEANYKQDLSLQDRFVGSTYQVFVDEAMEWNAILKKKWAFIFLYLTRLRKIIEQEGFTSKAFVSVRLMMSVQKTYNVFRAYQTQSVKSKQITEDADASFTPAVEVTGALNTVQKQSVKTVKDTLDEFFTLFTTDQAEQLKEKSKYNEWLNIVKEKNKLPMDKLNTDRELEEIKDYLANK